MDNFVSVKKLPKTPGMTSVSSIMMQSPQASEETKKIFTPRVKKVTRKRPVCSREEKERRGEEEKRRRVLEEENSKYLGMNTENLQMMKDHLEKVKLKMKELKEKKKMKKKTC